jgi:nitrite reductase/ring-hydroxylating ferredoxin subunit
MSEFLNYIKEKSQVISSITNSIEAPGIPSEYARIALPDLKDKEICDLIEKCIREYVNANCNENRFELNTPLHEIHQYLEVGKISACQEYVNRELQLKMLQWACNLGESRLSFSDDFYVDKEIYVRINYPFEFASKGESSSVTDPSHRLTKYNKGRPRVAWGHGPHKDSWYGHSHSAINLWFSICGTNEASTMTLYPDHAYRKTAFDEDTMYASYEEKLDTNVRLKLNRGENFIFDPEMLHSTRINTSDETRIVLTLRLSQKEPLFSDSIYHDVYDLWINSSSIRSGDLNAKQVGRKITIDDYPSTVKKMPKHYVHALDLKRDFSASLVQRKEFDVADNYVFELRCSDGSCLGVWSNDVLYKFSMSCPHIGAPLIGGEFNPENTKIKCPAHGSEFCLKSGESGSNNLRLTVFK